jgi:hypothetical protein
MGEARSTIERSAQDHRTDGTSVADHDDDLAAGSAGGNDGQPVGGLDEGQLGVDIDLERTCGGLLGEWGDALPERRTVMVRMTPAPAADAESTCALLQD